MYSIQQKYKTPCLIALVAALSLGTFFLGTISRQLNNGPSHSSARSIDPQHLFKGYFLFNGELIDANGRLIKQWPNAYLSAIDTNGDYYGQQFFESPLWGRYTWDNRVIWEKHFPIHHELYLSPQGTIFVFTREPHLYHHNTVDFDIILEFDKNGRQLQRYSFWDHLNEYKTYHREFTIDTALSTFFKLPWGKTNNYDYFHLNSLVIIPPNPLEAKNPAFRRGNWLISIRHGSMVFILDQDTKKIIWHMTAGDIEGMLQGQHSVSMLPNGHILLFENGEDRKASRILVIDPLTMKITWQYRHPDFCSTSQGFVQSLPNGNLLVTESDKGHAFEVTPDKKVVWEYHYSFDDDHTLRPWGFNTGGNHPNEIYRMTCYPKEIIDGLINTHGS